MSEREFENALINGKIVVVAGAGISKDMPANLPSWWEYNILLLEMIGKLGAEAIDWKENLLEMNIIKNAVPVVSVSDFFVNRIAGKSYFPLLEMLDGAAPNKHHMMLAQLAEKKQIAAIVTTNFDTLIEKAFKQSKIPYIDYSTDESYYTQPDPEKFPIYKIHGSAEKALSAIDTAQQKLQGLSEEKRKVLRKLFSENHILFIGFSGEDFLFDSDYIPVSANRLGITWIAHPGSVFNPRTQKIIDEQKIHVITATLPDFYKLQGWETSKIHCDGKSDLSFRQTAGEKISALLKEPHIGKWACVGMCIELLDLLHQYEQAEKIMSSVKKIFSQSKQIDYFEGIARMSLYSSMSNHSLSQGRLEEACQFLNAQMCVFQKEDELLEAANINETAAAYRERMLNRSTVLNRIGQIAMRQKGAVQEVKEIFLRVFMLSYQAMHWENISVSLYNIACCDYENWRSKGDFKPLSENSFVAIMEAAVRTAKRSGRAQNIFNTNIAVAHFYALFGQRSLYNRAIQNAEAVLPLCLDKSENENILRETKKDFQNFSECPPWPRDHMILFAPYNDPHAWDPYSERPILKYEEGKHAKELFDTGKPDECINYLQEKIIYYYEHGQWEAADAFSNSLAGILLDLSNKLLAGNFKEAWANCIEQGKACYEQCLDLEWQLGRFDYLAGTLGSLSQLNSYERSPEALQTGLFQAELCLCLCDDPQDCWQAVLAAKAACEINLKFGKNASAREYCVKYCEMVQQAPWSAEPVNTQYMQRLLERLGE